VALRAKTAVFPLAEICSFKAIQPAKQRNAGWNVEWACLKAYPRKHHDTRRQNVRRHRHDRGTSTPQAHCDEGNRYTWAYTAALPYAELVNASKTKAIQPSNAMRGGMWNGRASRRTQGSITIQENKTSAGIGTTVEHPPRERIETASIEKVSIS